jgi:hypothetical protein
MALPTAQQLVSQYKASGPLTAAQIVGKTTSAAATTANPHDAPGYNPATDPLSSAYGKIATPTATPAVNTATPNPATTTINPPIATPDMTAPAGGNAGSGAVAASPEQIAAVAKATKDVQNLQQQYQQGVANANASGKAVPTTSGEAGTGVATYLPPPTTAQPTTTPNVDNFFNPQTNPALQQSTQNIMDFLSPPNVQSDLYAQMSKIQGEQNTLSQEQLSLMNMKNVMAGTADDLRSEIQAVGGFGTESQIQALATSRNKVLLKQATFLQDQITTQQDMIKNDTTLMNFEKDMANTQFTQRMSILQYQQTNQNNIQNAARQSIDTLTKIPGGLAAYANDPQQAANAEQIMGWAPGTMAQMAQASAQATAFSQAQQQATLANTLATTANTKATTAKTYADIQNASPSAVSYGDLSSTLNDYNGQKYITVTDLTGYSKAQQSAIIQQMKANGVPTLSPKEGDALTTIKTAQSDLQTLSSALNDPNLTLPKSFWGQPKQYAKAKLNEVIATNPPLGAFKTNLLAVIPTLAALKGVGSGGGGGASRLFSTIADLFPKDTDTLPEATTKLNTIKTMLDNGANSIIKTNTPAPEKLLAPTEIPSGYYQASDGLLYKK